VQHRRSGKEEIVFRSILVPLDGSTMAEQAVLPAGEIARRLGARLWLVVVHPWGPPEDAPLAGSRKDTELRAAETVYLERMLERAGSTFDIEAGTALIGGDDVASALAEFSAEHRVDLVVSATRGRGKLRRFLGVDVSVNLAHDVPCPTLLIKPQGEAPAIGPPQGFQRILVPLDGTMRSEVSLEPALALAALGEVIVSLVRVISPQGTRKARMNRRREAHRYLLAVTDRLERRGVKAEYEVVERVNRAAAVLNAARCRGAQLIALTTRERGAGRRFLLGSVADATVHGSTAPVLICHAVQQRGGGLLVRRRTASSGEPARLSRSAPRRPVPVPA
jgi:nucleotide-binding universal stress UspA family protein